MLLKEKAALRQLENQSCLFLPNPIDIAIFL